MNLDDLLTRSARDVASDLTVPPAPDPPSLGARAVFLRRRRRMGVTAMAVAAALVGVAVLVPAMSARRAGNEPADEPPPDRLGNVPAWPDAEGNLHIGDDVIEMGAQGVRFALTARGVVWAETGWGETEWGMPQPAAGTETLAHLYWQSLDGERVELTSETTRSFATDPLGDLVVWVTQDDQLVIYDVREERVVDSRPVSGLESIAPVIFVDDDEIVYEADGDVWALDIQTGEAQQMPGVSADDLLDHGPNGSVVAVSTLRDGPSKGWSNGRSLAQLEFRGPSGTVRAEPDRLFREGRLSPDGHWFVTSTGYEAGLRTVVLDTTTGRQVPLDLPDRSRGARPDPWGWSGADVLMLGLAEKAFENDWARESVWACPLADRTCELLPDALSVYPW